MQNILKPIFTITEHGNGVPVYVSYDYNNSIFDKSLEKCEKLLIVPDSALNHLLIGYDIYWTNNPSMYASNKNHIKHLCINDLIYYRHTAAHDVKKEDKFLIQNNLASSYKIFRNLSIKNSWHINEESPIVEYGIPLPKQISNKNRKSVLFVNYQNNHIVNTLYKNLIHTWPDAGMLNSINELSYDNLCSIAQQYCVLVDFQDDYNVLFGMINGCSVISSHNLEKCDHTVLYDLNQLTSIISQQLEIYKNKDIDKQIENINTNYSFEKFNQEILSHIYHIIRKPNL